MQSLDDLEIEASGKGFTESNKLADACEYLLSTRGKLLRSSILLETTKYGAEIDNDLARKAAIAVEFLHTASLAHDDVVDEGKLRRGRETVGMKFGNTASVLSGGWLLARAVELVSECGDAAISRFVHATAKICEGEMLQAKDLFNTEQSPKHYFDVVAAKTASLFSLSALLGAELAGADEDTVAQLEHYGHELGMAFQISDDLLDLLSDDETTGKTSRSDLQHGIYTLPILYAMSENSELKGLLAGSVEDEQFEEIITMVRTAGGIDRSLDDCRRHAASARTSIESLPHSSNLMQIVDRIFSNCREKALT